MKRYGFNETTSFTRKQIGAIYSKAKNGELKVEKWYMSELYQLADFYGQDFSGSVEFEERFVLNMLRELFEGNLEEVQNIIDSRTKDSFERTTERNKIKLDRTYIGG